MPFPEGFLWGASTAGHQVEGSNWSSDWWAFEHMPGTPCIEPSGDACDHYHRFADDIKLVADLGLNAFRFSLEWARIEPEDGEFSLAALDHYKRVCEACRDHGIQPVITFNHDTVPRWLDQRDTWLWPQAADRFARFCERAARHLHDHLDWVLTFNHLNMMVNIGYRYGVLSPAAYRAHQRGDDPERLASTAHAVLVAAHGAARAAIKAENPGARIGFSQAAQEWRDVDGLSDEEVADLPAVREAEGDFFQLARDDDFVAIQVYSRFPARVAPGKRADDLAGVRHGAGVQTGARLTQMGYEFRPQAIGYAIRRAAHLTGKPVLVTENGVGTDDDTWRVEYIREAIRSVRACLDDGIDVVGYHHWSLLDNFEWLWGYDKQFGLVAVDRRTFTRSPKPSAFVLGAIARHNGLVGV